MPFFRHPDGDGPGGQAPARHVLRESLHVRWTFDERKDGGSCNARSLAFAQAILENPERYLGSPHGAVTEIPATRLPSS